jgi:hypothetical protein
LPKSYDEARTIRFIISANMRRCDLSAGQKTMIALEIAPHLEAAAKLRQKEHGKTAPGRKSLPPTLGEAKVKRKRDGEVNRQVAQAAGVAHGNVSKAKKVRNASETLAASVAAGTISLNDAHKRVRQAEPTWLLGLVEKVRAQLNDPRPLAWQLRASPRRPRSRRRHRRR